jgi:hypothetical protein
MLDVAYKMLSDVITHTECVVAVYIEEEIDYVGRDLDKIWDAATACDEVQITLLKEKKVVENIWQGEPVDWAFLVHGNAPDETICDYLHGKWIDNWCNVTDFGSKPYVQQLVVGNSDNGE